MRTPEELRAEDRRRRTERQREKRGQERICGYCGKHASAGLIEWSGRSRPLLIPICRGCLGRLVACWRDIEEIGPWCDVSEQRPCADCSAANRPEKPERGLFRRLLSG